MSMISPFFRSTIGSLPLNHVTVLRAWLWLTMGAAAWGLPNTVTPPDTSTPSKSKLWMGVSEPLL